MGLLSAYFGAVLVLIGLGLHVATVLFLLGLVGAVFFLTPQMVLTLGDIAWNSQNDFILTAVPLFVLMGELLLRSGLADRMYTALAAWLTWLPGGLLHSNIVACALFAATSGSSVATAATISTVALPNFKGRGYDERLVLGSLAAGGTLGILIPPSINMIIYGAMTNTSVGKLFIAGVIPGLILAGMFMLLIVVISLLRGRGGPKETKLSLKQKLQLLPGLFPPMFVFVIVMGGIYFGYATPTEAAAVGVVGTLILGLVAGQMNVRILHAAFKSTICITAMVTLIIVAAFYLNFIISVLGLPQAVTTWVRELGISPVETIFLIILIYLVLGCFLETLSMMITTVPIVVPLVVSLGFDPIWFGILLVVLIELALLTPPVGVNLYVVQGIRDPGKSIGDVILGVLPFILVMLVLVVVLVYLPGLATWLPEQIFVPAS